MYNVKKIIRDIAINIYALRQMNEMSARKLGLKIGKSESTITSWERGERMPSFEDILMVCNVFGCTLEELFASHITQ